MPLQDTSSAVHKCLMCEDFWRNFVRVENPWRNRTSIEYYWSYRIMLNRKHKQYNTWKTKDKNWKGAFTLSNFSSNLLLNFSSNFFPGCWIADWLFFSISKSCRFCSNARNLVIFLGQLLNRKSIASFFTNTWFIQGQTY